MCYTFPMLSKRFELEYGRLDKAQREAVDTIQGPVMVIAGPGTGKTTILTLRIANILRMTDTPPEAILALTFTESGVHAMRAKLAEIIGAAAYRVVINTFHGFANSLIQKYPESFPRIIGGSPASEIDQIKILETIFKKGRFKTLRPEGDILYYVRPALRAIRNLKKEGYTPKFFQKFTDEKLRELSEASGVSKADIEKTGVEGKFATASRRLRRNRELADVFRRYEEMLRKKKLYDYEDMLLEAVAVLESDEALLSELRETTHYILADEHQDANGAQNRLLELISEYDEHPNLFIVGDEKQAIFRFQGASLENFLMFSKRFPDVKIIALTKNFRSTQLVLDASHSLITKLPTPGVKRPRLMARENKPGTVIEIHTFETPQAEAEFVAARAVDLVGKKIAIIYRDNNDAELLIKALREKDAAFRVLSEESLLNDPDVENLVTVLFAINDLSDESCLSKAFFVDFLHADIVAVFKVLRYARTCRMPLFDLLSDSKVLAKVHPTASKLKEIMRQLERFSSVARNLPLLDFLDMFLEESGFTGEILSKPSPLIRLEHLHSFYELARAFVNHDRSARLPDFLSHLSIATVHGVRLSQEPLSLNKSAPISLLTAHRSKGLEFDVVFITRVTDERWGARVKRELFFLPESPASSDTEEDDERRLFYVAMTRAKERVFISHSATREDGKIIAPSRFLEDIDEKFLERREGPNLESKEKESKNKKTKNDGSEAPLDLIRELFADEGLTVTALNNYLDCPWKYFFQNLVRLPSQEERHQMYGTALHEALKRFQQSVKIGKKPSVGRLVRFFEEALARQPLGLRDFKDLKRRGTVALRRYYVCRPEKYSQAVPEMRIAGVPFNFPGGIVNLRGVIDLFIPVGDSEAHVIDYKTGKQKSRREIEGKTKNSNGNFFRQLAFYKILIEGARQGRTVVTEGSIVFVEPDKKGRCPKETFLLTEDHVKQLKEEIAAISEEIYHGKFWKESCTDKHCEFCALANQMREKTP